MDKGIKNIVLGIILATFHINIGTLPILPSFVGWILVTMGVNSIAKVKGQVLFNKAKILSEVLTILTLIDLIKTNLNSTLGSPYLLATLISLIELFLIYYFFSGITEVFKAKGKIKHACENERILSRYSVLHVIGILVLCICWLNYSSPAGSLMAIYMIALRIYVIYRVNKLGKLCGAEGI